MDSLRTINALFVDIDSTIIDPVSSNIPKDGVLFGNQIFEVIKSEMVEQGWDAGEATKAIRKYADETIWWDYPDFIAMHDLPLEKIWRKIYKWHEENLKVYADTVETIKKLHGMGKKLFIISNNPVSGCLLKLQKAGLADLHGSEYFCRIFGTNLIRGCKDSRSAWKRALTHIALPPEKVAVLGDNEKEDADIPLSCGAGTAYIIKRDMPKAFRRNGKITYLKSPLNIFTDQLSENLKK